MQEQTVQDIPTSGNLLVDIDIDEPLDINFRPSPDLTGACYSGVVKDETFNFIRDALSQKISKQMEHPASCKIGNVGFTKQWEEGLPNFEHHLQAPEEKINTKKHHGLIWFNVPESLQDAFRDALQSGTIKVESFQPITTVFEAAIMRDIILDSIEQAKNNPILSRAFNNVVNVEELSNPEYLENILINAERQYHESIGKMKLPGCE